MSEATRDALAAAHDAAFAGWLDAVDGLEPAAWSTPTGCPGWDVHDQLAHVVAIERGMLGEPPEDVELPDDAPYVRDEVGRITERGVHARRGVPPDELLAEARDTFARRSTDLARFDPVRLGEPVDHPLGFTLRGSQLLRLRVFDLACHEQDVRRALVRRGPDRADHLDLAVEQALRLWARSMPDRLGWEGAIEVRLVGHAPVTLELASGQLHRPEPSGSKPDADPAVMPSPDATVAVDIAQLLALAGGRTDAPGIDEILVSGDRQLARRWADAAAVTP